MNESLIAIGTILGIAAATAIQYLFGFTGNKRVGKVENDVQTLLDAMEALKKSHEAEQQRFKVDFAKQEGYISALEKNIERYERRAEERTIERENLRSEVQQLKQALIKNEKALAESQEMLGGKVAALETELERTRREKSELELSVSELNTFRISLEENNQKLTLQNQYLKDHNQRLQKALEGAGINVVLFDTNILGTDHETPTTQPSNETQKAIEPVSGENASAESVAETSAT